MKFIFNARHQFIVQQAFLRNMTVWFQVLKYGWYYTDKNTSIFFILSLLTQNAVNKSALKSSVFISNEAHVRPARAELR